jgi:hypothetical protein
MITSGYAQIIQHEFSILWFIHKNYDKNSKVFSFVDGMAQPSTTCWWQDWMLTNTRNWHWKTHKIDITHTHLSTNVQFFWSLNGLNSPTLIMFLPKNSLAQTTHDFAVWVKYVFSKYNSKLIQNGILSFGLQFFSKTSKNLHMRSLLFQKP